MAASALTLSQLLGQVKGVLANAFPGNYWIVAEILELHENRSGHCYLELIEKNPANDALLARARGTIWASRYSMLRPYFETSTGTRLKSGIKLLCKVSVEFHAQYGLSLNISDIDPSYTLGDLARRKQEVIRRLREDGVFDMNRELRFPAIPRHIAVVSSETAAGYEDFMDTLHNNPHGFRFITQLFPAIMQGDEAPGSITGALDRIYESTTSFDCVVIIRGGGSRADLESFNHYDLAYYITQFPLPVITGIGHDRDETVAEMVAAHGLKTPTAAAEFLVDRLLAVEFQLTALHDRLVFAVKGSVQEHLASIERYRNQLEYLAQGYLQRRSDQLEQAGQKLQREISIYMGRKKDQLTLMAKRTELVDPVNILKRGYTITLFGGKAIPDIALIKAGNHLETILHHGRITSKVVKTTKHNGKRKS